MNVKEWLGENDLGIDIWKGKYCYNNESFDTWLDRVSDGDKDLRQLIIDKKFLFGGRILSNRGLNKLGKKITLSNCYVVAPPEDNLESIFECATKLARTFSYGGGCGVDISKLSPKGARINNAAKETSGAISFMDLYSTVTGLIGQNGRRGALMISLDCNHPDLEEFIELKSDLDRVTKANISIRVTNEFLEAVKNNEQYNLTFVREETGETITKTIDAHKVFNKFAEMNWDYAEPAFLYWDRIENWNLLSNTEEFEFAGTNPCAEEPLPAGGSCLLGSINLSAFVKDKKFNFSEFENAVDIAIKALNDVLDEGLPLHPLQEQRDSVRDWRQCGLGIMGLADMLIDMEVEYGSEESLQICDNIGFSMINQTLKTSALIAKDLGTFPKFNYDDVSSTEFYKYNVSKETDELIKKYGLRNSQLLTIAPTGSISSMLAISGGIEPVYANYYERRTLSLHDEEVVYKIYTPIVDKYMKKHNIEDDRDLPQYFITAQNLNYINRINMQGVWQEHIDASISSTVNVPNDFTIENTEELYLYAYEKGLKGVTIFRDGCKRLGILTLNNDSDNDFEDDLLLQRGDIINVNDDVIGLKRKITSGCGSLHCTAFFDPIDGNLLETYLSKGSSGGCTNSLVGLSRMISLSARAGVDIDSIIDQLNSTGACPSYAVRSATKHDTSKGACCPMAVGNAIKDMWFEIQESLGNEKITKNKIIDNKSEALEEIVNENICPQCGADLIFSGGCNLCPECGWTKCD